MTIDILVVGAGHDGLVCAFYLASAGLIVKLVERRDVGGAAVTEESHPGFRNSVAAYTASLLNPKVIAEMNLSVHGLTMVDRRASNFLLQPGGRCLLTGPGRTSAELAKFSVADAEAHPRHSDEIDAIADVLRDFRTSSSRPRPMGHVDYRTGGVTGAPGHNAARTSMRDFRSRFA
ncbi:MAG: hypothetical protein E6G89_02930 [Alphaproteobacteria bacterium]|nr:MAG: hypothetical protein E6G89_02930 [Alphaproteobacteria bacterium]